MKITIPFHSGNGHTEKLASFIAEGATHTKNVKADLLNVSDPSAIDWDKLHTADAIVFGSPTYMGSVSGPFKSFMDQTGNFWLDQKWKNKIAAGFTVSSALGGDKLNSLIQLSIFAAQHGMIWASTGILGSLYTNDDKRLNEPGSWLGLSAIASRDKDELITAQDAETAKLFGARIAEVCLRQR